MVYRGLSSHSFLSTSYDTLPYFSVFQIKILFLPLNVYIKMRYCLRGTKRFLLTKIYFLCLGLYFPYRSAQKKLRHNSNGWNCVTGKECNQMGRKTFQFCVKPHWNVYDYQSKKWFYAEPIRKQLSILIIIYIVSHFYGQILMLIRVPRIAWYGTAQIILQSIGVAELLVLPKFHKKRTRSGSSSYF